MKEQVLAIYLRLSDEDGEFQKESNSITSQREILTEYIQAHKEFSGFQIVEFCDV